MKKFFAILLSLLICVSLCACAAEPSEESLNSNIEALNSEIASLEAERNALENEVIDTKVEKGTAKYVITFNIRQVHYSLDISEHFKDMANDVSLQVPVDKEYYDSVKVGDVIDDSFRMGSFVFKGSFGSWKITVKDKSIQ